MSYFTSSHFLYFNNVVKTEDYKLVIKDYAAICSVHFQPEDFEPSKKRKKLKAGAVPTIFFGSSKGTDPTTSCSLQTSPQPQEAFALKKEYTTSLTNTFFKKVF